MRIWNVVRTPAQIQQFMKQWLTGSEPGLEAYYKVDEGSGTNIFDATHHGHDGTFATGTNSPSWAAGGEAINLPAGLPQTSGFGAWGDFNKDGLLDFLLVTRAGSGPSIQVLQNSGGGFTNALGFSISNTPVGAFAVGDYNNDGLLDLLIASQNALMPVTEVWRNTGKGFTNINAGFPGIISGTVAWGDYDNATC